MSLSLVVMAGCEDTTSNDQDTLATVVKDVHAKLRKELKKGNHMCPYKVISYNHYDIVLNVSVWWCVCVCVLGEECRPTFYLI